jgi:hypothetical protein
LKITRFIPSSGSFIKAVVISCTEFIQTANITAFFTAVVFLTNGSATLQVLINESSVITSALSFCDDDDDFGFCHFYGTKIAFFRPF